MPLFGLGPKELWEHELEKLSKGALVHIARDFIFTHASYIGGLDRKELLLAFTSAKKYARLNAAYDRIKRFQEDPDKYWRTYDRRKKSAKAAARRRKAEARRQKKEGNL
jgi:transposase